MVRNIKLMAARLDIPFKESPIPQQRSPLPPIRQYWQSFYDCVKGFCERNNHRLEVMELPLWKMTPEIVNKEAEECDILLMPHRERNDDFWHPNIRFFMQTVFPEFFTIDINGWGANLSFLPLNLDSVLDSVYHGNIDNSFEMVKFFRSCEHRIRNNISKFDQPNVSKQEKKHNVLFICQIPHDHVIKYHSDITVSEALTSVLDQSISNNWNVLVKGHPVNPGSMASLRNITQSYPNATWIDNISIHDAIRNSDVVATVNSGSGIECIMHQKPVFTFGHSEYQQVVNYKKPIDIDARINRSDYMAFLYLFFDKCFNTGRPLEFFDKLERMI